MHAVHGQCMVQPWRALMVCMPCMCMRRCNTSCMCTVHAARASTDCVASVRPTAARSARGGTGPAARRQTHVRRPWSPDTRRRAWHCRRRSHPRASWRTARRADRPCAARPSRRPVCSHRRPGGGWHHAPVLLRLNELLLARVTAVAQRRWHHNSITSGAAVVTIL